MCGRVKLTIDINDQLLQAAAQRAKDLGKSLSALLEDALRVSIPIASGSVALPSLTLPNGLEDNDPFFQALEEIRASGRAPATHRPVDLE